jgi:endonuclease/exonuclease/phosphatase family metal-dependent hydrolase
MKIKIISFNIHKGYSVGRRNYVLNEIRELIRFTKCNLVFLQEVMEQNLQEDFSNQVEYLADSIWPHSAYGKNSIHSAGNHGNAILSEYPFAQVHNQDISAHFIEKRGLLYGQLQSYPLHLLNTHFGLLQAFRNSQTLDLERKIKTINADEPVIAAGDFNDWNKRVSSKLIPLGFTEVFEFLVGKPAKTFPSSFPLFCLDRIYVKNAKILSAQVLNTEKQHIHSDHLAIMAEIEI